MIPLLESGGGDMKSKRVEKCGCHDSVSRRDGWFVIVGIAHRAFLLCCDLCYRQKKVEVSVP